MENSFRFRLGARANASRNQQIGKGQRAFVRPSIEEPSEALREKEQLQKLPRRNANTRSTCSTSNTRQPRWAAEMRTATKKMERLNLETNHPRMGNSQGPEKASAASTWLEISEKQTERSPRRCRPEFHELLPRGHVRKRGTITLSSLHKIHNTNPTVKVKLFLDGRGENLK